MTFRHWIFLLITAVPLVCNAAEYKEGFEILRWGDSPAAVKEAFPNGKAKGGVWIVETKYAGFPATMTMGFVEDHFFSVSINFDLKNRRKPVIISQFDSLEKSLIKKFGKPAERIRANYSSLKDELGAISIGEGIYKDEWNTEESVIMLTLTGHNWRYFMSLSYSCREMLKWKQNNQFQLNGF